LLHVGFNRLICSMVVVLASNKYRKGCPRLNTNHPTSFSIESLIIGFPTYLCCLDSLNRIWLKQLPTLHYTVIGFALDWESHKSLKNDCERLTELVKWACFQQYAIQRIQPAEVGWESDNKGFARERSLCGVLDSVYCGGLHVQCLKRSAIWTASSLPGSLMYFVTLLTRALHSLSAKMRVKGTGS